MSSVWRPSGPQDDAGWRERRRLHDAARAHAAADPTVRAAMGAAQRAFDACILARTDASVEAFWDAIAAVAAAAVSAAPPLAEIAWPLPDDDEQLPVLAAELAAVVAEARIERDEDPFARAFLEELRALRRARVPRTAFLRPPEELRRELLARGVRAARRARGRPPGRRRGDVPRELTELVPRIRSVVRTMVREERLDAEITELGIAHALGVDAGRLREAFRHHGLDGRALLAQLLEAERDRDALVKRMAPAIRGMRGHNLDATPETVAERIRADVARVREAFDDPRIRALILPPSAGAKKPRR